MIPPDFQQVSFPPFNAIIKHTEAKVTYRDKQLIIAKGAFLAIKNMCGLTDSEFDKTVEEWAHKVLKRLPLLLRKRTGILKWRA